ncbi:unnamed protein product [Adineta ricciae]|uniref:G-protein coupled receptors family 1 profile domain-containing protein n=1 Tax=Adineta ricciae TaxID=249248 RepID=A0A816F9B8_ADIRI|nr:unnamed protein product [Adineta ricciae]
MNFTILSQVGENLTLRSNELWFIPFDVVMIIFMTLSVILTMIFLIVISINKTCHTVQMMFVTNRLFSTFILGLFLLGSSIFTFRNDLQQIQYEDLLCIFRGYMIYASGAAQNYSNVVEACYRYFIIIYPTRLYFRSFYMSIAIFINE